MSTPQRVLELQKLIAKAQADIREYERREVAHQMSPNLTLDDLNAGTIPHVEWPKIGPDPEYYGMVDSRTAVTLLEDRIKKYQGEIELELNPQLWREDPSEILRNPIPVAEHPGLRGLHGRW